ncbi:MAG: exo-alpha-sialidase, partial [Chloroflexi bacterium]
MKLRLVRLLAPLSLAGVLLFQPAISNTVQANVPGIDDEMNDIQGRLLSGFTTFELSPKDNGAGAGGAGTAISYSPRGSDACPTNQSSNIKVNQNCLNLTDPDLQGRGQAQNEESIAADPNQPNHLVASYNDYRRGDGTCGVSYSLDKGRTWNDATTPNNFTRNPTFPREYWQAGGDTSVGWDTKGNAYLSCQLFKRGPGTAGDPDRASGFFVFRSTQNSGASFNFPGRPVFQTGPQTTFLPLEDKQFMAVD